MAQPIDLDSFRSVHLLGIGGIGVSAVARLLLARGIAVSGCDVRDSSITQALAAEGARVFIGHSAEHLPGMDLVVVSSAIPEANPEWQAARERGVRTAHRSEVLDALMRGRHGIGVTGTNGKGTVSALIAFLLHEAGQDPTFAIGAILLDFGTNARAGRGRPIVCELDESDGSFANVHPEVLVINNLEADHLNYYRDLEGLLGAFERYLGSDRAPRVLHANGDDPNVREVLRRARLGDRVVTHGEGAECCFRIERIETRGLRTAFRVRGPEGDLGWFEVGLPGRYNAWNAVAALGVAVGEGVPVERAREALPRFRGLENRFTVTEAGGRRLVKDYISHPTGIREVLRAARGLNGRRLVAVFKPYRFTMIHYLQDEYRIAFEDADLTVVTEMYPAGEVPIPGVDTAFLVQKIRSSGTEVLYVPEMESIPEVLSTRAGPGDVIVFFGGDDLFRVADRYAAELRAESGGLPHGPDGHL